MIEILLEGFAIILCHGLGDLLASFKRCQEWKLNIVAKVAVTCKFDVSSAETSLGNGHIDILITCFELSGAFLHATDSEESFKTDVFVCDKVKKHEVYIYFYFF
jgi:hypothetical protein